MVGYNVQAAVDTTNHLIVAHEVSNVGTDKSQLANMANQAKAALEAESLEAFAESRLLPKARRSSHAKRPVSLSRCQNPKAEVALVKGGAMARTPEPSPGAGAGCMAC